MRILVRKDVYFEIMKSLFNSGEHPRGAGGKFIHKFAPDTGANGGGSSNNSNSKKNSSVACPTTPQKSGGATSTQSLHHNNISFLDNMQELSDVKNKIDNFKLTIRNNLLSPDKFLEKLKVCFNADNLSDSAYAIRTFDSGVAKIRISDHKMVVKNRQGKKTLNTSIVIQLNNKRGRSAKARVKEFIYKPETLTSEVQQNILKGIDDWIKTGIYSDNHADDVKKSIIYLS